MSTNGSAKYPTTDLVDRVTMLNTTSTWALSWINEALGREWNDVDPSYTSRSGSPEKGDSRPFQRYALCYSTPPVFRR